MSCLATGVRTQLLCLGLNRPPSCRSQPDAGAAQCCRSDDAFRADGASLPLSSSALLLGAALVTGGDFFKVPSKPKRPRSELGRVVLRGSGQRWNDSAEEEGQGHSGSINRSRTSSPFHPCNAPPQLRQAPPALWDDVTV